jgi:undecaprenyl diphosphate synthase
MNEYRQEMPQHVVIIPDGNRRWAKDKGLEPWAGHEEGAKMIKNIVKKARNMDIKYLSFWGSSVENMKKRPIKERRALIKVYEKYFTQLMSSEDIFKDEVCINVFGYWKDQLPISLVHILEEGIEKTKHHKKYFLNFFLSYSGDEEMIKAIQSITDNVAKGTIITRKVVKEHLLTKDIPPVDYLIRTGGEPHLSTGFMMWDIANAQLFFSNKNFPDFDSSVFSEAIEDYILRKRRLGA